MDRPHAFHSRSLALVAATAVAVGACSTDSTESDPWNGESYEVASAELLDFAQENGLFRTAISPSGRLAAVIRFDEVCFGPVDEADSGDTVCLESDIDNRPEFESLNWSSDESRVVFVGPSPTTGRDPDITTIDLSIGEEFEVLTDDGVDELSQQGDFDFAPFFGPDGDVYFFRLEGADNEYVLHRIDDDGDAVSFDDVRLPDGVIPEPITRQLTETTAAIAWLGGDDGNGVSVIDLEDMSIEHIDLDRDVFNSTGASSRYVVVGNLPTRTIEPEPFHLVDVETGRSRQIRADLDEDEQMNAAGLVPSGDAIVANVRELSGQSRLVLLPITDGRVGDPIELVDVGDLDEFDDFDEFEDLDDLFVSGLGSRRVEMVATTSGQLFVGVDDNIARLTFTSESAGG